MTQTEFTQEVRRMRPMLVNTALRIVGNADEAEDVVQDALLRLWTIHDRVDNLPGMARVVVRNLSLDLVRHRPQLVGIDNVLEDDGAEDDSRIEQMMTLINDLPTRQQTILRLRHVQGFSMQDIAQLVGSSEAAVRQSLSRARRTVRRRMRITVAASFVAAMLLTGLYISLQREPKQTTINYQLPIVHAQESFPCAQGTPREQYACFMEQRRTRTNTYQQLKRLAHENH